MNSDAATALGSARGLQSRAHQRADCVRVTGVANLGLESTSDLRGPIGERSFRWLTVECILYHLDQSARLERLPHAPILGGLLSYNAFDLIGSVSRHQDDAYTFIQFFQAPGKLDATHSRHHYID